MLGSVELVDGDGRSLAVGSANQRLVLAALVAHRSRIVVVDALVDTLWPDDPPASAVSTLRTYVSRLRRHLGKAVRSHPAGWSLELADDELDATLFESMLADADHRVGADQIEVLRGALALWRGPAFGTERLAPLVRGEAVRLHERALHARVRLAVAELGLGRIDDSIAAAESLVADVPHHEPAWVVLVRALSAAGRTVDALRAYQRAADTLADLGLEPSTALRAAEHDALDPVAPPGATTESIVRRTGPPSAPSQLIGRVDDLDAVLGLLGRVRLVTLVGTGGVGKTRLANEVAHRVGAAVWVDLSSVASDADVAASVLAALGVRASGQPAVQLLGDLVDLDLLVVLDNAEHVIDGVAAAVTALMAGSSTVRLVVTSREALGVAGEQRWHVAPMTDGATLFVERAAMSDPSTPLDPDDPRVADVVRRLDGLPLALEMAAAQLATMSVDELQRQLALGVSTLRAPRRPDERQRDLGSLIEWSERLLDHDELSLLHETSVFAGGIEAADVASVLERDDVAVGLRRLAERSLLELERVDGATRFRMLVTVRDHAAAQLGESGRTEHLRGRHAAHFLAVAREADGSMRMGDHTAARRRFAAVRHELRAAHRFARVSDPERAGQLSDALLTQARYSRFDEPFGWAESMLVALTHDRAAPTSGVWAAAATRSIARGDLAEAWRRVQHALEAAGDDHARLPVLDIAGDVALFDGRQDDAMQIYVELTALGNDCGERLFEVIGGAGQAMAACYGGDARLAASMVDEQLQTSADSGPIAQGWLHYAGGEAKATTDLDEAFAHYRQAIDLGRAADSPFLEGVSRVSLGSLQARIGDVEPALMAFGDLVKTWLDLGERTYQRTTLRNLVVLLRRAGRAADVAVLSGSVDRDPLTLYADEIERLGEAREWARQELGDERYEVLRREGSARDVTGAATWALGALRGTPE